MADQLADPLLRQRLYGWYCISNRRHDQGAPCDCWETWFRLFGGDEKYRGRPASELRSLYLCKESQEMASKTQSDDWDDKIP